MHEIFKNCMVKVIHISRLLNSICFVNAKCLGKDARHKGISSRDLFSVLCIQLPNNDPQKNQVKKDNKFT